MDCMSLRQSSKQGHFWANAAHFVVCNQAHGQMFFASLVEELQLEDPDINKFEPAFNVEKKDVLLRVSVKLNRNRLIPILRIKKF